MKRLLITVCTYNELDNIRLLVPALREVAPHADVLVIDDNSPDGTGAAVSEMAATDAQVQRMHREEKAGLGAATLAGFRYGIDNGYDLLLNLDADFSHHPRYIPDILELSDAYDVTIGSRYIKGGDIVGWPFRRHIMSRTINAYARLCLGLRTRDNSGSYRCYHVSKLAQIDWDRTVSLGYAFQEEILYRCQRAGCTFTETPIVFEDRQSGVTKINLPEIIAAVRDILKLCVQRIMRVPVCLPAKD